MKLTKICLFLVALLATLCVIGCNEIEPEDPNGGNVISETVREVAFFDFEKASWKTRQYAPEGDGATIESADGAGIDGSNCILVTQTDTYGEVILDMKKAYSKDKTYYFEGWFKDAGTPESVNGGSSAASLSLTVWDKDIVDICKAAGKEYYDYDDDDPDQPGPWAASVGTDITGYEIALKPYQIVNEDGELEDLQPAGVEISADEWTKLSGVVRSKDIDSIVSAKNKEDLVGFLLVYYCGTYPAQTGYVYYLDNIRILDLDPQIPLGNGVYVAAPALRYGSSNVIEINIALGDNEDVFEKNKETADYCTFTCEGELPAGVTFDKESGYFEGEIAEDLVEEGDAEGVSYTVTVKAVNKAGEATAEVTFKIINAEPAEEEEPVEGEETTEATE